MIAIGQLVRVMNAVISDSVFVGTVTARRPLSIAGTVVPAMFWLKVQPAFGHARWILDHACEVVQESDL